MGGEVFEVNLLRVVAVLSRGTVSLSLCCRDLAGRNDVSTQRILCTPTWRGGSTYPEEGRASAWDGGQAHGNPEAAIDHVVSHGCNLPNPDHLPIIGIHSVDIAEIVLAADPNLQAWVAPEQSLTTPVPFVAQGIGDDIVQLCTLAKGSTRFPRRDIVRLWLPTNGLVGRGCGVVNRLGDVVEMQKVGLEQIREDGIRIGCGFVNAIAAITCCCSLHEKCQ